MAAAGEEEEELEKKEAVKALIQSEQAFHGFLEESVTVVLFF